MKKGAALATMESPSSPGKLQSWYEHAVQAYMLVVACWPAYGVAEVVNNIQNCSFRSFRSWPQPGMSLAALRST